MNIRPTYPQKTVPQQAKTKPRQNESSLKADYQEPRESWDPVTRENAIFTGASVATAAVGSTLMTFANSPLAIVAGAALAVGGTLSGAVGLGALASGESYKEILGAIGEGMAQVGEDLDVKVRSDGTTSFSLGGGMRMRSDGSTSFDLGGGMRYNSKGGLGFDLGNGLSYEAGKGVVFEF